MLLKAVLSIVYQLRICPDICLDSGRKGTSGFQFIVCVHQKRHKLPRELCVLHCDPSYDANICYDCTFALLVAFKSVQWSVTFSEEKTLREVKFKGKVI